ncbi:hypothetical protein [Exiguobacterium acetylicum]|uniref:hypothetical protein n=1 Tax=Exiguobacterium acetylicum TaxID=41170 RepID=UPI001EE2DB7D|nr:hypothetical protein [Exiguobacterium acetylicum]UKS54882.1 hypothetical protein K6T22_09990 [Exiguobacterium acetylicum]
MDKEWRKTVAQNIEMNIFLKSTTSFDSLSKYVREELEELREDLQDLSNDSGTLILREINNETVEYLLPLVNGQEKGFQVHFNEGGGIIAFRSVDSSRGTRVIPIASIEPTYSGARFYELDNQGEVVDEETILPDSIDRAIRFTLF